MFFKTNITDFQGCFFSSIMNFAVICHESTQLFVLCAQAINLRRWHVIIRNRHFQLIHVIRKVWDINPLNLIGRKYKWYYTLLNEASYQVEGSKVWASHFGGGKKIVRMTKGLRKIWQKQNWHFLPKMTIFGSKI